MRVSGAIVDVSRSGARWRAELLVGGDRVPISGLAGSGIPSTALEEGRVATVVGIVRRPYPSAADRRFAIVPRSSADVALGPRASGSDATAGGGSSGVGGGATSRTTTPGSGPSTRAPDAATTDAGPLDVDLADLAANVGRRVRAGGLVVDLIEDGITLDDGTAVASVRLSGEAADHLPFLEPGDVVNVIGVPALTGGAAVLVASAGGDVIRVPALGERVELDLPSPTRASQASPAGEVTRVRPMPGLAALEALPGAGAGIGSLLLVAGASVAIHLLRQGRARRLAEARALARLARLVGVSGRPEAGPGAPNGSATARRAVPRAGPGATTGTAPSPASVHDPG